MTIYLGLGANEGDRKKQLLDGIDRLVAAGFRLEKVSPMVESPAMLPEEAKSGWNKPYFNVVISGNANWSPEQGLRIVKKIEGEAGRQTGPRWSPRPLDIDLLVWHDEVVDTDQLTIPHIGIPHRDFVITPLLWLSPNLVIPGLNQSVFALSQGRKNIPQWMGILNLTPDSFSDGGTWLDRDKVAEEVDKLIERDVPIIDVGAESTRPRAEEISEQEEWRRLQPILQLINDRTGGRKIRPLISVDSRHPKVVEKAINLGVDIINDVTGLDDINMLALARESGCQIVAMHAMTVPVDPKQLLPNNRPAVEQIQQWISRKAEQWSVQGLDLSRMIIDPGIGFGKSSIQAFELMTHCNALRQSGMRLLIGHSRKSFMSGFTDRPPGHRDMETLGISLGLCQQGVDVIRVHQPFVHQRAYRAWAHMMQS